MTVTELTARLRDLIEAEFFEIWVEGEISNCRSWSTGHLYFTLKDQSAQIRAIAFRSTVRRLRFKPVDGVRVIARGRVSVYETKGEYQLVCEHMEPQGLGALQLAFDQLKARLRSEGLFEASRKRPLPQLPRKIGIVTSPDGAALRDLITVLGRRHANAHLIISPARVQGEGAAEEIARSLTAVSRVDGVDVIIVGRGGGSMEDLWAFNEEAVARAIAACPVPVISAVGHETDFTIADFVADLRAPTPSAAAEIVVARRDDFCGRIDRLHERLSAAIRARLQALSRDVHVLTARSSFAGFPVRLAMRGRLLADLTHAFALSANDHVGRRARTLLQLDRRLDACGIAHRLQTLRTRLVSAGGRLAGAISRRRSMAENRLRSCAGRLDALSPLAVLSRGYAVCWNAERTKALRDAGETTVGDRVRVTLANGELECEVRRRDDVN
jgi:exodeoxyribonuclease VII large subunit